MKKIINLIIVLLCIMVTFTSISLMLAVNLTAVTKVIHIIGLFAWGGVNSFLLMLSGVMIVSTFKK